MKNVLLMLSPKFYSVVLLSALGACGQNFDLNLAKAPDLPKLDQAPEKPDAEKTKNPSPSTTVDPDQTRGPTYPCPEGHDFGVKDCQFKKYPAQNDVATVAYEDLLGGGDEDYNDFLGNIRIFEIYDGQGQLEKIFIDVIPRARGAGYTSAFVLSIDGRIEGQLDHEELLPVNDPPVTEPLFKGEAKITVKNFRSSDGALVREQRYETVSQEIVIFPNLKQAMPEQNTQKSRDAKAVLSARVEISLKNKSLNRLSQRTRVPVENYRFLLAVKDTGAYVDLADVVFIKPEYNFSSSNVFGILVPSDWYWPLEGEKIHAYYPHFREFLDWVIAGKTTSLSKEGRSWFVYRD